MTDVAGYRATIGVLVPSTNTMVESDLWSLRVPGVTFHAARMYIEQTALDAEGAFDTLLAQIDAALDTALRDVLTCEPDHLVMGMSAPTFHGGRAGHDRFVERVRRRSGMEIVTGARSCEAALEVAGARRIALLTPYQPSMSREIARFFRDSGVEVVRGHDLCCASATAIARVPRHAVEAAFAALDGDDVDALVQIGTNLSAVAAAAHMERVLGKPVLANNAASAWRAYRTLGFDDRLEGAGSLLREH